MKTTKEIINNHLVNEGLSLINKTEQGKEYLKLKWYSESEVKLIVQVEKGFWKYRIEQLQKELNNSIFKAIAEQYENALQEDCVIEIRQYLDSLSSCLDKNLPEVFNNFMGK